MSRYDVSDFEWRVIEPLWPIVSDSRSGGNQGGAYSRFRAVGHRKGSKQLLNISAGLVRTVVRNEPIVHGHLVQFQRTNNPSEFFRARFGARGNQRTPCIELLRFGGIFRLRR